jgi:hypothetical protein
MLVSVRSLLFRAEECRIMKVYNLACEQNHRFEGWFGSEDDFLSQSARQLIVCPVCESAKVDKLPSAPHLNLSAARPAAGGRSQPKPQSPAVTQMQKRLMDMARHVMENTEDVGEGFAEEARRIHYKEVPEHGIRGVASAEQCDELAEEGIDVFHLPLAASRKSTLQ